MTAYNLEKCGAVDYQKTNDRALETTLASLLIAERGLKSSLSLEGIAEMIHDAWCAITLKYEGHNPGRSHQMQPYRDLTEVEKAKDRIWVQAI